MFSILLILKLRRTSSSDSILSYIPRAMLWDAAVSLYHLPHPSLTNLFQSAFKPAEEFIITKNNVELRNNHFLQCPSCYNPFIPQFSRGKKGSIYIISIATFIPFMCYFLVTDSVMLNFQIYFCFSLHFFLLGVVFTVVYLLFSSQFIELCLLGTFSRGLS